MVMGGATEGESSHVLYKCLSLSSPLLSLLCSLVNANAFLLDPGATPVTNMDLPAAGIDHGHLPTPLLVLRRIHLLPSLPDAMR